MRKIITGNERAARAMRLAYGEAMRRKGRLGWFAPDIQSLDRFVEGLWLSSWPTGQLIGPTQELAIWIDIVEQSDAGRQMISCVGAARGARTTARTVAMHGGDPGMLEAAAGSVDSRAFAGWYRAFHDRMGAEGLLNQASLYRWALDALERGAIELDAGSLELVGVEEVSGLRRRIVELLLSRGATQRPAADRRVSISLEAVADAKSQWDRMASVCRELLFMEVVNKQPEPSIGVAVADLSQSRPAIERALRAILSPGAVGVTDVSAGQMPWRYLTGDGMDAHPLSEAALDLLSACISPATDLALMSRVLLSPDLWTGATQKLRSRIDIQLRKNPRPAAGLRVLANACAAYGEPANDLRDSILRIDELRKARIGAMQGRMALPSEWAALWAEILQLASWTGCPAEGTDEPPLLKQFRIAWEECGFELNAMDRTSGPMGETRCLQWFRDVLGDRALEPSVEWEQPVQILSHEDLAGLSFDYLIICDATSADLPPPPRMTGFVSPAVMEHLDVPDCTPERQLARWEKRFARMPAIAKLVHILTPHRSADGAEREPSPLVAGYRTVPSTPGEASKRIRIDLDQIEEPGALPAGEGRAASIRGGTRLVSDAAQAPLVAVLRHRLGLTEFPRTDEGISALDQGQAVHEALKVFWNETKDRDRLLSLGPDALRARIEASAAEGRAKCLDPARYGTRMVAMEEARIIRLLEEWLAMEATRPHPFSVHSTEKSEVVDIHGVRLKVIYDRLDQIQLPSGDTKAVIIDYKVGSTAYSAKAWDPAALKEPQLPIYASFIDWSGSVGQVDGIAIGMLTPGNCSFATLSSFTDSLGFRSKDKGGIGEEAWQKRKRDWVDVCDALVTGVLAGDIRVNREAFNGRYPKNVDLAALCAVSADPDGEDE